MQPFCGRKAIIIYIQKVGTWSLRKSACNAYIP